MTRTSNRIRFTTAAALALALLAAAAPAGAQVGGAAGAAPWPPLASQLARDAVQPGTPLEALIAANQDFQMLHPSERSDLLPIPFWLRVHWRKAHPEWRYDPADPTGGYPFVLKEVHDWMRAHQDLVPGPREPHLPPGYEHTLVGPNLRLSGAQSTPRSESDIRVNFWNPNLVIAASNNIGGSGRQGQYYSNDGGTTWGQTTLPLVTGDSFHSDPAVDWTSNGTAWSIVMGINSAGTQYRLRSYRSTDNGTTWTFETTVSGSQTTTDKQLIWADHSSSSPHKDNVYVIWHNGAPAYMNRRVATTGTWGSPVRVSFSESTGTAIGADVKTNSAGEVFGFWPATGNRRIFVVKSTNGGASYGTPVLIATSYDSFDIGVPAFNNRRALIYVSAGTYRSGPDNLVYASWTDLSGETGCTAGSQEPGSNVNSNCKTRIWFSRSTNGGSSWSAPVKINNQPGRNDQFNQWLAVDEATGRIAIVYYDTVGDPGRKRTDIWYQTSEDDGVSWAAPVKVTTAMTDETNAGSDSGNQYGDYNGLSGWAGTFLPSWTDRRNAGREEIWTAEIGETPCTPPPAPTGLTATAVGSGRIDLAWNPVGGASEYHLLRSTTSGGPYSQIAVTTGTAHSDTGLTPGVTYYYVVRAFAGCESGNSNEAFAVAGGGGCSATTLYSHTFETGSGLSDWTRGTFGGSGGVTSWRGIQTCTAQTGTRIFRYGGVGCTDNYTSNNFNFAQPNGAGGVGVPAGATTTRLKFGHRRRFESTYDGGSLTLSLDGASYVWVPGTAIIGGTGYNGTIANDCPPSGAAGASVFTGVQSSFVDTEVDLDAVCNSITGGTGGCAGRSLRIGFTAITDCSVTDDGWFLDNVTVTACVP